MPRKFKHAPHVRLVSDNHNDPICCSEQLAFAARESIGLSVVPMLALAQRRITEEELDELDALCAQQPQSLSPRQIISFRFNYWTRIASAAQSSAPAPGMQWWIRVTGALEERLDPKRSSARSTTLIDRYRELARALRRRSGAVEYWLTLLEPVFGATEARLRLGARQAAEKE